MLLVFCSYFPAFYRTFPSLLFLHNDIFEELSLTIYQWTVQSRDYACILVNNHILWGKFKIFVKLIKIIPMHENKKIQDINISRIFFYTNLDNDGDTMIPFRIFIFHTHNWIFFWLVLAIFHTLTNLSTFLTKGDMEICFLL